MVQLGRKFVSGSSYRFGFNGKEKNDEVNGYANQLDYGMRIYDPRTGKFLSVDPIAKEYPELTPYQYASNRPIESVDKDGEERVSYQFSANFAVNFSDQGPRFRVSTSAGVGITYGAVQAAATTSLNIYNGGLGTAGKSSQAQFDVSGGGYLTLGGGSFRASSVKTINNKTESPIENEYAASITMGNAWTYSSATNRGNKQLFFNFKTGPVTVDYHNDDRLFNKGSIIAKLFGGSGKDEDWSGGVSITLNSNALGLGDVYGKISYGFETFTGVGTYKGRTAPVPLQSLYPPETNKDGKLVYSQGAYQTSLNKSSKFLSIGLVRIDYDNGGKAQTDIHTGKGMSILGLIFIGRSNNPIFIYPYTGHQSVETSTPTATGGGHN